MNATRHSIGVEYLNLRAESDIGAIGAIQQIAARRSMEPWEAAQRLQGIIASRFIERYFPGPSVMSAADDLLAKAEDFEALLRAEDDGMVQR